MQSSCKEATKIPLIRLYVSIANINTTVRQPYSPHLEDVDFAH